MNELALFAGAGGGILGGRMLGWRTVCAVEYDEYARNVLVARQNDGNLEAFPIWDDVRSFDGRPWRGVVDVVSGGFPCQDISIAGKGCGLDGERSGLWREMARIVGEVQPKIVWVENSTMLVRRGGDIVLSDLASMGYDCSWGVVGADDAGAPHRRNRIWILAYARHLTGGVISDDAIDAYLSGQTRDSGHKRQLRLQDQVRNRRLYPTVTVHGNYNRKGASKTAQDGLATAVRKMIPTPVACASKGWSSGHNRRDSDDRIDYVTEREAYNAGKPGRLNPDWVEWLMGWPVGWTDVTKPCDDAQRDWAHDPADDGSIPRVTERRTHRSKRIVCLGNGQVPQAMVLAYHTLRRR